MSPPCSGSPDATTAPCWPSPGARRPAAPARRATCSGTTPGARRDDLSRTALDARYPAAHLAFFRSAWSDPKALYVGFKGGDNKANHSHLDLGTFVLDALGQRWAMDLGPDDYNLPGYFESPEERARERWTYYRLAHRGPQHAHPGRAEPGPPAAAPLVAFGSASGGAFAVADLTRRLPRRRGAAGAAGVALRDDRSRVLVQDEVESERPLALRWAMHTRADVRIVGERGGRGDRAVLSLGGAMLEVRLLAPARPASPWGRCRCPSRSAPRPVCSVLEARLEGVTSARLAVLFTPLAARLSDAPTLAPAPALIPLERWRREPARADPASFARGAQNPLTPLRRPP